MENVTHRKWDFANDEVLGVCTSSLQNKHGTTSREVPLQASKDVELKTPKYGFLWKYCQS